MRIFETAFCSLSDASDPAPHPLRHGLRAVREGRVAIVDGNQMFNRPGPRLVEAFEWLVGLLHDRWELMPANFPWRLWQPSDEVLAEAEQQEGAAAGGQEQHEGAQKAG